MIITKLIGGLGNQLFQYAAGKQLSEVNKTCLLLDIGDFNSYKLHKYSLSHLNINEKIASPSDIKYFNLQSRFKLNNITDIIRLLSKRNRYIVYRENFFHYDHNFINLKGNIYIDGYWQSEKYFHTIPDIIKKEFTIKNILSGKNYDFANKVTRTESVSVHIRRGDYVKDKKILSFHGVCDLNYYQDAISIILKNITNPVFFIFSDDQDWVKKNLRIGLKTYYVDINGPDKNYEDLRLMKLCKHNIIANSTFSWWGAWLNQNKNKIVVTPKYWFTDHKINTSDLIPQGWLRV